MAIFLQIYIITCILWFLAIVSVAHIYDYCYNELADGLTDKDATEEERVSAYVLTAIISAVPLLRVYILLNMLI